MPEEAPKKEHAEKHLDKLTIKELRELAAALPHERAIHDMKKEELIAFIKEARGIKEEKHPAKKAVKSKRTRPELKARIRELKTQQGEALEARDRKQQKHLRRRVSRLKKLSRHAAAA